MAHYADDSVESYYRDLIRRPQPIEDNPRIKARKANRAKLRQRARRHIDDIMADCGLVKVRGSVSGQVYYE